VTLSISASLIWVAVMAGPVDLLGCWASPAKARLGAVTANTANTTNDLHIIFPPNVQFYAWQICSVSASPGFLPDGMPRIVTQCQVPPETASAL
jgi:hypothetical protein